MSTNMFSQNAIDAAVKQNAEEQKKLKQKLMPRGFHVLILKSIKHDKTKAGDPMFVITINKAEDKADEFREVVEYLPIQPNGLTTKEGVNLNVYNLLLFFNNAFGLVPKEPDQDDPYGDIEKQFQVMQGQRFRGVISHKMELNTQKTKAYPKAGLVFKRCANVTDTTLNDTVIDPNQYFTDLSPKDKAILKGDFIPEDRDTKRQIDDVFGAPDIDDGETKKLPW